MSKTYKDLTKMFDTSKTKKHRGEASARFKIERKRKDNDKLFKREVNFVNYIMQTSQED
jgi:hypothetical protein